MLTKNNLKRISLCNKYRKFLCFLDFFFLKKKNRIVFCSWPDLSDNAKVFYDFMRKYHSDEWELVFLWRYTEPSVQNKKTMGKLFWHFSIKGILAVWTSKFLVMTHDDFYFYLPKKHILLELFHGMPIKAVGFMEKNITPERHNNYRKIGENAYFFVTSDVFMLSVSHCFHANFNHIYITGQSRTDSIFYPTENAKQYVKEKFNGFKKICLYCPTYREKKIGTKREIQKSFNNIFYMDDFDSNDFYSFLTENEILVLMKPHPQDEFFYRDWISKNKLPSNLKLIFDSDLKKFDFYFYELFSFCDFMLSDYSSIAVDFLITQKPCIYLTTTVDEYIESRGMVLNDNYQKLMIGDKVHNYEDLKKCILKILTLKDAAKNEREKLSLLHKYFDGNSSERIYQIIKNM